MKVVHKEMMISDIHNYSGIVLDLLDILGDRMKYICDSDLDDCDDKTLESLFMGTREIISRLSKIDTECFGLLGDDWNVKKI